MRATRIPTSTGHALSKIIFQLVAGSHVQIFIEPVGEVPQIITHGPCYRRHDATELKLRHFQCGKPVLATGQLCIELDFVGQVPKDIPLGT